MPNPLDDAKFYTLSPEAQHLVMSKVSPKFNDLSPEARKIVLQRGMETMHGKNLQAGQALEGSSQPIKAGRLTGTLTPPPTVTGELGKGLIGVGKGAIHAAQGVGQMAQGITDPMSIIQGEMQRQQEISKKPQTIGTDLERIPLIGAAGAGIVEDWKKAQGSTEDFGEVLGRQGLPILATAGLNKAASGPTKAAATRASAVDDISKALGAQTREQLESIAEAHPAIHHELVNSKSGAVFDKVGTKGYLKNAQDAQKTLWKETFDPELQKFGQNVKSMDPVAQNIRGSIDAGSAEIDPGLSSSIESTAKRYEGKHWTLNKIQARQKALRAEIDGMNAAPNRAELMGKPANAAKLKELDTLTNTLYDDLSSLSGKDFSAARYRYKALKDVEDMARKADDRVSTMDAAARADTHPIVNDLLNAKGVYEAGAKVAKKTIARKIEASQHPDALIGSGLKKLGGKSRLTSVPGAKGQAAIPFTGEGIPQTPVEGQGPLFQAPQPLTSQQQLDKMKTPSKGPSPESVTLNPYDTYSGPIEPQQSMEGYLSLNNVSPEAQQFFGYRKHQIPPPPRKP